MGKRSSSATISLWNKLEKSFSANFRWCLLLFTLLVSFPVLNNYFTNDELNVVGYAALDMKTFMGTLYSQDFHPPLYYLYYRVWYTILPISLFFFHLPTYILFLLFPQLLYTLMLAWKTPSPKLMASLCVLSPYLLHMGGEIRPYMFLATLGALAAIYWTKLLSGEHTWKTVVPFSLLMALLPYAHHYAWFSVAGFLASLLFFGKKRWLVVAIGVFVVVAYIPLMSFTYFQMTHISEQVTYSQGFLSPGGSIGSYVKFSLSLVHRMVFGYTFQGIEERLSTLFVDPLFTVSLLGSMTLSIFLFAKGSLSAGRPVVLTFWISFLLMAKFTFDPRSLAPMAALMFLIMGAQRKWVLGILAVLFVFGAFYFHSSEYSFLRVDSDIFTQMGDTGDDVVLVSMPVDISSSVTYHRLLLERPSGRELGFYDGPSSFEPEVRSLLETHPRVILVTMDAPVDINGIEYKELHALNSYHVVEYR